MRVDQIEIHVGTVDFQFDSIRRLEVKCEARTNFSRTPTIAEANAKLQELAAGLGANAVVDVKYESGMSMTSWRSLKATGLAVKKSSDEVQCPRCAELIKRAAKVCRFCGAEFGVGSSEVATPVSGEVPSTSIPVPVVPPRNLASDQEPLRATDNSQVGLFIAIGAVVLLAILGALGS